MSEEDKDQNELATKVAIWGFLLAMGWVIALGLYALTMWVHRVAG